MYDRETGSEWKQSSGECIDGPLRGRKLRIRPAAVLSLESFRERYRDGLVLQPPENATSKAASDGDEPAPVDCNETPYAGYFESDGFGLAAHRGTDGERFWEHSDFDPKTVVLGLEVGSEARGYPFPQVEAAGGVVHETVGGTDIVVLATGEGIHAFENPGFEFERTDDGTVRADGTAWDAATGSATDGRRLDRLPARRLFAFAWRDDHGVDSFYRRQ